MSSSIEFILPHPSIPLSGAVKIHGVVFVSGQVGFKPGTNEVVEGGVEEQTRATLENVRLVLEMAGSSVNQVLKTTVFLTDVQNDFGIMNKIYSEFFGEHRPARSTVGVAALARKDLLVEIECVALAE
ncbi:MAG: RidA family protein [Armatimonadetes bacterium]|nr:RidA family protein [Armatimonadota bacterium]